MPSLSLALLTYEKLMHNERLTNAGLYILRTLTYAYVLYVVVWQGLYMYVLILKKKLRVRVWLFVTHT